MAVSLSARDQPAAGGCRFEPFDLTVNLGPDAIAWLSAVSCVGSVHGVPRAGSSLPQLTDLLDHVYDYTDAVQFAEREPDPQLSRHLGDLVFGEPAVLELFQAARGVAADRGRQLLFRILTGAHLATLPWELLPDPAPASKNGHRYLALAPDTHLVRLARGATYPARAALLEAPLNLLLVLSSPTPTRAEEDYLAFDIFEINRALLAELAPLVNAGLLNVVVEDRPTLENLQRRIGEQHRGYHLFHYVGHALPNKLVLEDRAHQRKDLGSREFVELLRLCPDLRLAVFAGCETARAAGDPANVDVRKAGWRDLLSLAENCVQDACPAAIGMQAVLPFTTERMFTRFFYQALASGYSTAEALRLARSAIRGDERLGGDLLDWSVPALFVGSSEPGPLLPRSLVLPKPVTKPRRDLKIRLRESDVRFYGRDLQLRQAVDIMTREASERVLIVSGAAGVGKTELVNRALEEVGKEASHALYVPFGQLAEDLVRAGARLDAGDWQGGVALLAGLESDLPVRRLCFLITQLLQDRNRPIREPRGKVKDWWELTLIETLVQHQVVLVIDDADLVDGIPRRLLEWTIRRWLADSGRASPAEGDRPQVLEQCQALLSELQDNFDVATAPAHRFPSYIPTDLQVILAGLPSRLVPEIIRGLMDSLGRLVVALSGEAAPEWGAPATDSLLPVPTESTPKNVMEAVTRLEDMRRHFGEELRVLAERRSPVRIALVGNGIESDMLGLLPERVCDMRLAPLAWPETWWWIRRNLPALLSYGEPYLCQLWSRLGSRLDQWQELERLVLRARDEHAGVNLVDLARSIAPLPSDRPAVARGAPAAVRPSAPPTIAARRGERALRIAVAGGNLAGPAEVCEAITRLAIEHGINGRVGETGDKSGVLVSLVDEPTPFDEEGRTDAHALLAWLRRVSERVPDLVLLDYASLQAYDDFVKDGGSGPERDLLHGMHYGSLLIAAGGHRAKGMVTRPSVYPEVLGVGPLDDTNHLRPYAEWTPQLCKPDLFMADNLERSPLAVAVRPGLVAFYKSAGGWGSSFSALHAVATATLVWALLPELSPRGVRALLLGAAKPVAGQAGAAALTTERAVRSAQERAVMRRLEAGPASLQTLSTMTGLDTQTLAPLLQEMVLPGEAVSARRVVKLVSSAVTKYALG